MKKFIKYLFIAAFSAASLSFSACGDDEPDKTPDIYYGDDSEKPEPEYEVYGTWRAQTADATIQLSLNRDNSFTKQVWNHDDDNEGESISGTFNYNAEQSTLSFDYIDADGNAKLDLYDIALTDNSLTLTDYLKDSVTYQRMSTGPAPGMFGKQQK